jgi:HD-like signal output (HDOD) protein
MTTAKKIINKFSDIQTLPHVVTKLSKLIANSNSTIKEFEDVIKMDPVLVARLLRLVNSPFYGLAQKVDSIGRAVAFIGMKNLHNMAITDALKNIFREKDDSNTFSRKRLWMHCAAVSICGKMVAERIFGINGEDVYLCGILHDFGIIVEEQVKRAEFLQICRDCHSTSAMVEQERLILGTDHCEIGYLLTLEWAMPVAIQEAIRDHHTLFDTIKPESITGIIQISEYLVGQLKHTTLPSMEVQISPPLLEHIRENSDEYSVLMEDLPEEMSKAQDIYGSEENA